MITRSKEELLDICKMRIDGFTLQEIGDKYGITKERVRQVLLLLIKTPKVTWNGIVYPNLKAWMMSHDLSMQKFGDLIGFKNPNICELKLKGKSSFKVDEIAKILEITGLEFKDAFERENEK